MIAAVWTGNSVLGLTSFSSSAAVVVMILKVDPGGCGAEKAIPASAADLAVRRVERRDAAEAAGERGRDRLLDADVDRRAHGLGGLRLVTWRARAGRRAARRPGVPRSLLLEDALEPV